LEVIMYEAASRGFASLEGEVVVSGQVVRYTLSVDRGDAMRPGVGGWEVARISVIDRPIRRYLVFAVDIGPRAPMLGVYDGGDGGGGPPVVAGRVESGDADVPPVEDWEKVASDVLDEGLDDD
jgi:hypothetical protein